MFVVSHNVIPTAKTGLEHAEGDQDTPFREIIDVIFLTLRCTDVRLNMDRLAANQIGLRP
jgi:hypothetical protein